MATMNDFRDRFTRAGLQDTVFADVSGVSRTVLWRVLKGQEPRATTGEKLLAGLAKVAAILCPDDRPDHPGVPLLAADADLLEAHAITEEELATLATVRIERDGLPVVMGSKGAALSVLLAMRVR